MIETFHQDDLVSISFTRPHSCRRTEPMTVSRRSTPGCLAWLNSLFQTNSKSERPLQPAPAAGPTPLPFRLRADFLSVGSMATLCIPNTPNSTATPTIFCRSVPRPAVLGLSRLSEVLGETGGGGWKMTIFL